MLRLFYLSDSHPYPYLSCGSFVGRHRGRHGNPCPVNISSLRMGVGEPQGKPWSTFRRSLSNCAGSCFRVCEPKNKYRGSPAKPPGALTTQPATGISNKHDVAANYGINTVEPVVRRPSRARCASAASLSAKLWRVSIRTAPACTTSKSSLAAASKSSRLAR